MAQKEKESEKRLMTEDEMKLDFELMLNLDEVELAVDLGIVPAKKKMKKPEGKMERKPK